MVEVPVESKEVERLWRSAPDGRATAAAARERVAAAREFARSLGRTQRNARLAGEALSASARLDAAAERLLARAAARWSLSARAVHRTLRVARTVSDLAGSDTVPAQAVAEALSFRHEASAAEAANSLT